MTNQNEQTINSLNEQLRILCDSNIEKSNKIQSLTKHLTESQNDCEKYEVEINKLIKEKQEKNNDIILLSEAFDKKGISYLLTYLISIFFFLFFHLNYLFTI